MSADVFDGTAPANSGIAGAEPSEYIFKNLHMIGTMVGSMLDTQKALEFAERVCNPFPKFFFLVLNTYSLLNILTHPPQGLLKPVYEVYPIAQLPEAVQKLHSGKVAGRCVVDFNS